VSDGIGHGNAKDKRAEKFATAVIARAKRGEIARGDVVATTLLESWMPLRNQTPAQANHKQDKHCHRTGSLRRSDDDICNDVGSFVAAIGCVAQWR
jgi:hypothetical protein